MKLLTADEVKKDASDRTAESLRRSAAAAIEEARINLRLSLVRTQEQEKRDKYQEETGAFIKKLSIIKSTLEQEVSTLESRKIEALRPIGPIKEQLEKAISLTETERKTLQDARLSLTEREETLAERIEGLDDRGQELDRREAKVAIKEKNLELATETHQKSTVALSEKWLEFHEAVTEHNAKMEARENDVKAQTQANLDMTATFEKREKALNEKERGINDKYYSLIEATKEFEKKYGKR